MESTMASDPIETAQPGDGVPSNPPTASSPAGADAEAADAATLAPTLESVSAERDAAQQQAREYLALAQRAQADFQNYRRRAEQERAEAFDRGRGEVLLQMLPVLDDFERAMQALPPERRDEDWVQGLALIERKLRTALENTGVERIAAEGQPFDPWEHEAVLHEERDDVAPGTVAAVARPGYRLGGRVLRPAQVVVAKES
jgi:molecular chaperone GrpE